MPVCIFHLPSCTIGMTACRSLGRLYQGCQIRLPSSHYFRVRFGGVFTIGVWRQGQGRRSIRRGAARIGLCIGEIEVGVERI